MILIICQKTGSVDFCGMVFSKFFGYAIRSIVYLALQKDEKARVQLDEIADTLNIPRYFLGKVMNRLAKEGIIDSVKGHNGGFSINDSTLSTRLSFITELTGDGFHPTQCVLHLGRCNSKNPCPVHQQIEPLKQQWNALMMTLTVNDLLTTQQSELVKNIVAGI